MPKTTKPRYAKRMIRAAKQRDGNVLMEAVVTAREREDWFFKNLELRELVQEGIRQSRAGATSYLGSFTEPAGEIPLVTIRRLVKTLDVNPRKVDAVILEP